MPIMGRTIAGAGLQGLGEGLQQWSAQTIKRKQIEDEWKFELYKQQLAQEAKRQDAQMAGQQALIGNIMKDPGSASAYIAASSIDPAMRGVPIEPIQQLARTVAPRLISQQVLTAPTTEAMGADLGRRFTNATGQDYGSLPLQPALDLQKFGGEQPDRAIAPELQSALSDALTRAAQLRQAEQDKIAQAAQKEREGAYGKGMGEGTAKLELAPQMTAAEIEKINQLSGPEAAAAAAKRHEEELAAVAPDVTAGKAGQATAVKLAGLTPEIRQAEAVAAGAKRSAEEQAAAGVKYDPANMTREIQLALDKAQADANVKRDATIQASIDQTAEAGKQLVMQLVPLQDLYARAMKGDARAWSQYRDLSGQLGPLIAKASGYHGSAGPAELATVSSAIPGTGDYLFGTADAKWNYLRGLATTGPILNAQLPKDASVQDYMTAVQRLVDAQKTQPASARSPAPTSTPTSAPAAPAAPLGLGRPLSVVTPAGWAPPSTAATHVFNPKTGRHEVK